MDSSQKNAPETKSRSFPVWLWILAVCCLVSLIWMVWVLVRPASETGTFTPPPFEESARTAELADLSFTEENRIQAGDLIVYAGMSSLKGEVLDLPVWNSPESKAWIRIRILDEQGNTLGETGVLKPSETVDQISLSSPAASGKMIIQIMGYEPETYHSAGSIRLSVDLNQEGGSGQ